MMSYEIKLLVSISQIVYELTMQILLNYVMLLYEQWWWDQGAVSIRKTVLPGMAIPMLKIRRPNGRLIFNMEIAIRR